MQGNFLKTCYKTFFTSCRPRLYCTRTSNVPVMQCTMYLGHVVVVSVVLRLRLDHLEGRRLEISGLLVRDGGELSVRGEVAVGGEHGLADVLVLPVALEELPRVLGGRSVVHAVNWWTRTTQFVQCADCAVYFPGWSKKQKLAKMAKKQKCKNKNGKNAKMFFQNAKIT